ncbi:uncharacterized protein [Ptychodera flava]|uniref:uncharacterized protein n=1 Tax=Ptychodera flava TaxID=63121 RepID=UPI00396A2EB2
MKKTHTLPSEITFGEKNLPTELPGVFHKMAYDQRSSCVIGVVLLICGSISVVLGVSALFVDNSEHRWIAAPVWSGVIAALTGLLGLVSGKGKSFPGPYTITTLIALNLFTALAALVSWVTSILGMLDDGASSQDVVRASRGIYAVCLTLGVTEMLLASAAVVMSCAGVCCCQRKREPSPSPASEMSQSDSGELYTLKPGDQVIEAADGAVVIVSEGQVLHPDTCQIKIISKERKSVPPPYGVGSIDAADVLRPEAIFTPLPFNAADDDEASPGTSQRQGENVRGDQPDLVAKTPPANCVEADMEQTLPPSTVSGELETPPPSDLNSEELS